MVPNDFLDNYNREWFSFWKVASGASWTMLEEMLGKIIVVDLRSPFVCLGTLKRFDDLHLELRNADLHDLRDTQTSRENYVAACRTTGVKRNRKRVFVVAAEVVAISFLDDVVDE